MLTGLGLCELGMIVQYSVSPLLANRIDGFRIYSGVLSAEEVAALAAD